MKKILEKMQRYNIADSVFTFECYSEGDLTYTLTEGDLFELSIQTDDILFLNETGLSLATKDVTFAKLSVYDISTQKDSETYNK